MVKEFLKKVFYALSGGQYRVVVERQQNQIVIKALKGERTIPLSKLSKKHIWLSNLSQFLLPTQDNAHIIPLAELHRAKTYLNNANNEALALTITPEVAFLERISPPADFKIIYIWSYTHHHIERQIPGDAVYFGQGWFVSSNYYWQISEVDKQDDDWLTKAVISDEAVIPFLRDVLPNWQTHLLPCYSNLTYSSEPVIDVIITEVEDESITLEIIWKELPEHIKATLSTLRHIVTVHV